MSYKNDDDSRRMVTQVSSRYPILGGKLKRFKDKFLGLNKNKVSDNVYVRENKISCCTQLTNQMDRECKCKK